LAKQRGGNFKYFLIFWPKNDRFQTQLSIYPWEKPNGNPPKDWPATK
jgi:hypothetical protein